MKSYLLKLLNLITTICCFSIIFIISNCSLGGEDSTASLNTVLKLEFTSSLTSKLIAPNISMDISSYRITGTGPLGSSFIEDNITGNTYVKTGLPAGTWTVTVEAKNSNNIIIGSATEIVEVRAGETTTKVMRITPLVGNGTLRLSINWPTGFLTQPTAKGTLKNSANESSIHNFTISGTTATLTVELPSGYYDLTIELFDSTVKVWGKYEAVRILAGHISEATYQLTLSNLSGQMQLLVEENLNNPLAVVLTGGVAELLLGTNMNISASTVPAVPSASYSWFLNGEQIPNATGSSLTIGETLPLGLYTLDVRVTYNGSISSAGIEFKVVQNQSGSGFAQVQFLNTQIYYLTFDGTNYTPIPHRPTTSQTLIVGGHNWSTGTWEHITSVTVNTSGQFTLTFASPAYSYLQLNLFSNVQGITVSDLNVRTYTLRMGLPAEDDDIRCVTTPIKLDTNKEIYTAYEYVYVDRDCSVSGTATITTEDYISYTTFNNCTFKAGWNIVRIENLIERTGGYPYYITQTISIVGNIPSDAHWVLNKPTYLPW